MSDAKSSMQGQICRRNAGHSGTWFHFAMTLSALCREPVDRHLSELKLSLYNRES